jgi:hypothetical protein
MTSIVLFRCHQDASVCCNRIGHLKALNPDYEIDGLFGGDSASAEDFEAALGDLIDGWYAAEHRPPWWNWRHGDLLVREWFQKVGHRITFDRIYLIEWDLLLLDPLSKLYRHVPRDAIAVTARFPLREVAHDWVWMTNEGYRLEWSRLHSEVVRKFGYNGSPYASLGPGTCYSRGFLERYCAIDIPELTNDELRVPLFAQCFGITIADTGFRQTWDDADELRAFNCHGSEVDPKVIQTELSRPNGRRAFHPYRSIWPPQELDISLIV